MAQYGGVCPKCCRQAPTILRVSLDGATIVALTIVALSSFVIGGLMSTPLTIAVVGREGGGGDGDDSLNNVETIVEALVIGHLAY